MKIARLTIVTENQNSLHKAKRLAKIISEILTIEGNYTINKYEKFENSYKIDFIVELKDPQNSIIEGLEKTDRLCSPWTVRLIRKDNEVELIFNKSITTTYPKNEFNVIVWGYWEVNKPKIDSIILSV
jgi:hypothetical protein